jgi:hypothetical protein
VKVRTSTATRLNLLATTGRMISVATEKPPVGDRRERPHAVQFGGMPTQCGADLDSSLIHALATAGVFSMQVARRRWHLSGRGTIPEFSDSLARRTLQLATAQRSAAAM